MRNNRAERFGEAASEIRRGPEKSSPVVSAVQFAHLVNTEGGASMSVHTNKIAEPGQQAHFVGAEPDKHGNRIPTQYHGKTEIDASGGYHDLPTAVGHMKARNEKALWSMATMNEVRNPDHVEMPAGQSGPTVSDRSDLSPVDVLRHKARLIRDGGNNPAMTLGAWRDNG